MQGEWFRYAGNLKRSIIAFKDKQNIFQITDLKTFQYAGLHLAIRQRLNRASENNNGNKFKKKIKKYITKENGFKKIEKYKFKCGTKLG